MQQHVLYSLRDIFLMCLHLLCLMLRYSVRLRISDMAGDTCSSAQAGQGGQLMSSSHASKSNVGVAQSCRAAAARDGRSSNPYANQYATLVSEMTAFSHVPSSMYARSEAVDMEGS